MGAQEMNTKSISGGGSGSVKMELRGMFLMYVRSFALSCVNECCC